MPDYQTINPATIAENMMQNAGLIRQFLTLYLQQIPEDFQQLKEALVTQNHAEIASKAHHIKPTMEYIGATVLRQKFQEIESAAKNQLAITLIHQQISDAEQECNLLLEEIKQHMSTL